MKGRYKTMRKPTVAELRHNDVLRLTERSTDPEAFDKAYKAMNSFYKLAGFSERLFYINNDEALYTRYTRHGRLEEMEAREDRWIKRLNGYLKPFNLEVQFSGIYPSLVEKEESRIVYVFTYGYWYN